MVDIEGVSQLAAQFWPVIARDANISTVPSKMLSWPWQRGAGLGRILSVFGVGYCFVEFAEKVLVQLHDLRQDLLDRDADLG